MLGDQEASRRRTANAKVLAGFDYGTVMLSAVSVLVLGLLCGPAYGQDPARHEQGVESDDAGQVSLSADRIIAILREEPGLLLEVKRLLVRKTYDQGYLLDETDLTDEALFSLLNKDARTRSLATEEIERRGYIRVFPRREQTDRKQPRAPDLDRDSSLERFDRQREARQPEARMSREQSAFPDQLQRRRRRDDAYRPPGEEGLDGEMARLPRIRPDHLPETLAIQEDGHPLSRETPERPALLPKFPPSDFSASPPWREFQRRPTEEREPADSSGSLRRAAGTNRDSRPRAESERRVEQPLIVRRANPYADVPSLYDLYAQVSRRSPVIERFGADVFRNGRDDSDNLPMDLPVGPDYVIGPGDGLMIDLWGSVSQRLQRIVDREGRVALPEVGPILVTGRTLGQVQQSFQAILRRQFREVQADVSLSRLRTVRVYVVGDVERPGAYDISALSTPLNALYAAGGPTDRGSLRGLRHYRGKQIVQEVDAYDLLLRGIRSDVQRLEAGDTVLVPPVGPQVTVEGLVRRPAIYEIKGEKSLFDVLTLAGGIMPAGALRRIDVERIEAHQKRIMLSFDPPDQESEGTVSKSLKQFPVQDGDRIRIAPILPYSHETVYLDGHVVRPGKFSYREGMKVTDLIKSYSDLLPEPSARHAEIVRLQEPDFRPVVIAFNLAGALAGGSDNLALRPFDTVRVFSRYDFEDAPAVTIAGEVRQPGEHRTNGEIHVRDAIYLAGGLTPDAGLEDVQVFRKNAASKLKVLSVNLGKALAGDPAENILIEPKDRILVHRNLAKLDPPTVFIQGEVANPGKYPLGEGMTASQLVRLAGGFKRSAFTESADLTRTTVLNGQKATGEHREVEIAKALSGDPAADVVLKDGDTLAIRQLAGWNDIGAAITIRGEVLHPGTYGIREGEKLSSVLKRAGGFRTSAYPSGAVLERVQVRELAEKSRAELIRRIQAEQADFKFAPGTTGQEQAALTQTLLQQQQQVVARLKSEPTTGRLVVKISPDIAQWENTPADIEVRAGDVLVVPKRPNFVLVSGQVYNPAALTYTPRRNAGWYLSRAGGPTELANRKAIFVVRVDGSVVGAGANSGWWKGNVLSTVLQPGDTIVVPEKALGGSTFWKNVSGAAQVAFATALSARVIAGL